MNPYTIDEWIADFELQARLSCAPETRTTGIKQPLRDYFYSHYRDSDPVGRIARFFQAMEYLDENMDSILDGQGGVAGAQASLVGIPVVKALFEHFAHLPSEQIYNKPTIAVFLDTAKRYGA